MTSTAPTTAPSAPPDVPADLPDLDPLGGQAVAAAQAVGDAAAAAHDCAQCQQCPQCAALHRELIRANHAFSDLTGRHAAVVDHLRDVFSSFSRAWADTLATAMRRWASWGLAWASASSSLQAMLADNPWLPTGAGLDPSEFSMTPREGWIAHELSPGVTLWVASEELLDEVGDVASAISQVVAFQTLQADVARLWDETQDARARAEATEVAHDAAMGTVRAYWDAQTAAMRDAIDTWEQRSARLRLQHQACMRRCEAGEDEPDVDVGIRQLLGPVAGAVAAVAGVLLVIAGQPFDTGLVVTADEVASPAPSPSPEVTAEPSASPTVALPDATTDQAMVDTWAQGLGMPQVFDGTDWTAVFPPDLSGKFAFGQVSPPFRTSFFAEPIEPAQDGLGPAVPLVGSDVTHLALTAPGPDPVGEILSWYDPVAVGTVPPELALPSDGVVASSVKFLGDLFDPAFCSGRTFQHVVVITDPDGGPTFSADPSFPGDYYDGGNRFAGVEYVDCEPRPYLQEYDGVGFPAQPFPGGHLVSTVEGVGTSLTMLLPDVVVPDGSALRQVVFEVPTGQPFTPENTRYQAVPDVGQPPLAADGWTTTDDCDFSLPTPGATGGGDGSPAPAPSATAGTDGGGTDGGTDGDDGSGTDGGTDGGDRGTDGTDGTGEPAPTEFDGAAPAGTVVDPDETDGGLITAGLLLGGLGGALLGGSTVGRREDEEGAGTGPPPSGPRPTPQPTAPGAGTRRLMKQPIPNAPADGGGGTRQPIPNAPADGGGGTRQPIPPGPPGGASPGGPTVAPYEPAPGEPRPTTSGTPLPNAPADGTPTAPTPLPTAPPDGGGGTRVPMGTGGPAPEPVDAGPTTTLPGADELAAAREREREARAQARQEALSRARTRVEEAEREHRSAVARRAAREGAEANEGTLEELHDWWTDKDDREDELLTRARREEEEAYDALRTALSEYATLQVLTAEADERDEALRSMAREAPDERGLESEARVAVESVIDADADDRDRIQTMAVQRGRLRSARAWQEALALARNRLDPSSITRTLDGLASGIRDTRRQREYRWQESETEYDAREWLRDTRRDLRIETAITLTERGTVLDPRDGSRVSGTLRQRFAADRLTWMAEYLEHSSWRRDDPRDERATMIRQRLADAYRALDYVGNGDVSMAEYFLAVTVAVRERQSEVNTWFVEDYLGLPSEDQGGWWDTIKVGWSVKAGTSGRVAGLGEDSLEVVRQRIRTMNVQADEAVRALQTAAETPNPDDLPADVLSMLGRLGYLRTDADGQRHYQLPNAGDTTASSVTRLDRPGASWLDVLSVRNASEILVSVALPELAAVRIAAIATRLGLSARAVTALRVLADQGLGLALDVGFNVAASGGQADLTTVAFQSLVMSWTGMLGRRVIDTGAAAATARLTASDETRALVVRAISEAFGVPSDAVQQLVFQSLQSSEGVTEEDLYAALLGSAINRYLSRVGTGAADRVEDVLTLLPRGLREASLVLTPTMRDAIATDARRNAEAEAAFDAVVGGSAHDRATGTRVFEALRTGELSWSQLQRVYTVRGETLATVMDQVRIERDRFAQSVTSRARAQAREDVASHYDPRIRDADSAAERTRLETERQAELDRIGDPTHEVRTAARFTSEGLEIASATREELLDQLGDDPELGDLTDAQLRTLALDALTERFEEALGEPGDVIQPGSAGATSDIDRSWSSEFLRRAAQRIILAEMTRGRIDGAMGPTTARAFDVNEYVNVMTRISDIITRRAEYADLDVTVTVRRPDGSSEELTLSHADVVEANSLAGAMLHMDGAERERFQRNHTEGTSGAERARLETMFTHAHAELARSAETLERYVAEEAERLGTSTDDPDTRLRARDRLYGDRMAELDALGHRIDAAPEGSPSRAELMSRWERLMNTALRDGIETYSDMANLDIIVIRLQSQRNEDGSKKTVEQLLRDPSVRTEALAHVTDQQLRSMLNDQVLMLMHHVTAYHHGHESAAKAVRSLAKYTERALLTLGLLGRFHPDRDGPYTALWDATRRLIRHKDQPELLLRELTSLERSTQGDVEASMRWYLDHIEAVPGMDGLTTGPSLGEGGIGFDSSVARRDWWRRREAATERGAGTAVDAAERADAEAEIARLTRALERLRELSQYRPADRRTAERLLEELSELTVRRGWLDGRHEFGPDVTFAGDHVMSLQTRIWEINGELQRLREAGRDAGVDDALAARIAAVEHRIAGNRERLEAVSGDAEPATR